MASITKRANKKGLVYRIQVKAKDKGSGKDIVRSMTWAMPEGMTYKQADREVILIANDYEKKILNQLSGAGECEHDDKLTFKVFSAKWLERCKETNSLSYYVNSQNAIKLANDYIGGYKLTELTPRIIQQFYDKIDKLQNEKINIIPKVDVIRETMQRKGIRYKDIVDVTNKFTITSVLAGKQIEMPNAKKIAKSLSVKLETIFDIQKDIKPYAYETMHKVKRTVRAILSVAKRQRLVDDNYATADYITFPKRPQQEIDYLNDEQAKALYATLINHEDIRVKTSLITILLTGLRRGELCGLEWQDIDLEKHTLSVKRSVTTVKGFGIIEKDPKTESSKRTMTIPQNLAMLLYEYKEWQESYAISLGDRWEQTGRVFTAESGGKINPDIILQWLKRATKKAGLPHATVHSLRHTNITMQIVAGVPLITVAGRAGHARTSTTTDVYSHFLKSSDQEAADKLNSIFG